VTELRCIVPVAAGAFAAADGGARWKFHGALTMDGAAAALEAADALPLPSTGVVDFSGLLQADSAALAVIIALKRRARRAAPADVRRFARYADVARRRVRHRRSRRRVSAKGCGTRPPQRIVTVHAPCPPP